MGMHTWSIKNISPIIERFNLLLAHLNGLAAAPPAGELSDLPEKPLAIDGLTGFAT